MFIIQWKNKYSGETGYVKKVNQKLGFFENTFEKENANVFKNKASASRAFNWLTNSNEAENNVFEIETIAV